MTFRVLCLVSCLASPVLADETCLTAEALSAGGVTVTVKGGSTQVYRAKGKDVVAQVPVLADEAGFVADLVLARGLHVISDHRTEREGTPAAAEGEVVVGGNDGGTLTTLYKYAALPKPGKDWQGKISITRDQDGPSIGPQPTIKGKVAATVAFLPEDRVTISGCAYRIQPVETVLTLTSDSRFTLGGEPAEGMSEAVGQVLLSRRQIWFPDLGFAVITRERGSETGWSEDWGQGIIGLVAN
jgi:hypothetical protein